MEKRRGEIPDADKKAIRSTIDDLVSKYGLAAVRAVSNNYFKGVRVRAKLKAEIAAREKELAALKAKMGG